MEEEKGIIRIISKLHLQKAEKIDWNTTKGKADVSGGKDMRVYGKNGVQLKDNKHTEIKIGDITDFDISFSLDKSEETVVPLGILNFDDKYENPYFTFKYTLSGADIDSLSFEISDETNNNIYAMGYIKPVIISSYKKPIMMVEVKKEISKPDTVKPLKIWDYSTFFKQFSLPESDYTQPGSYLIKWDGFDNNEVYDSTRFNNKALKAKIIAKKGDKQKSIQIAFSTVYKEVNWVDVKIDKKAKRIDSTIRVNLKDGGAKGFEKEKYKDPLDDPRIPAFKERYVWDKIPASETAKTGKPPVKIRTRSFADLEKLALQGLDYHWGRNNNHSEGKNVMIDKEPFEVFVNPVNIDDDDKAMDDVSLIYNTNGDWMRSGNPGTVEDPISFIGNIISREAICYNVGYIKYSNGWGYSYDYNEDVDFKFTAAHEIGHTILKAYGGTFYSYGHKGTVNTVTQNMKSTAPAYPPTGEIDIMPYYPVSPPLTDYKRYEAAEKDVLSLIWLTKLKIK